MAKGDGGNNGGNKNTSGLTISTNLAPEDVSNREKLSGLFTTLLFGAFAMLGIAHVGPKIRTKLFRCEGEAPKGLDKNQVFEFVRSDQPIGLKTSLVQSIYNSVDDEGKAKIASLFGNTPKQVVEVNVNEAAPAPAQQPKKDTKPADNGSKGNGKK